MMPGQENFKSDERFVNSPTVFRSGNEEARLVEKIKLRLAESDSHAVFDEESRELVAANEVQKSPEFVVVFDLINQEIRNLCQEIGVPYKPVPINNFHLVHDESLDQAYEATYKSSAEGTKAFYDPAYQTIYFRESEVSFGPVLINQGLVATRENFAQANLFSTILNMAHEMVHMSGYESFYLANKAGDEKIEPARTGVRFKSIASGEKQIWFEEINEALTQLITKRVMQKLFSNKGAAHALKQTFGEGEYDDEENDFIYKNLDGLFRRFAGYEEGIELLDFVVNGIAIKFPERFTDKSSIEKILFSSYFNRSAMPLIRLLRETYGDEGFEIIKNAGTFSRGRYLDADQALRQLRRLSKDERRQKGEGQLIEKLRRLIGLK